MANENLKQTKNKFKIIGKVTRIDKDGAFREETATKGKYEGTDYRSLRFGIKSSETNENTVSMFAYKPEKVFLWNSEKKKKDKNYKGDWVAFEEWEERKDEYRDNGYAVLQTRVGLTYDENGKLQSQGLPAFVSAKEIYYGLNNGDSVVIEGNISYSRYKNRDDKWVEQRNFNIEKCYLLKDIDFDDEKFEEVSYFEQEIVYVDAVEERSEKKVYVTGRHINYNKTWHDTQFVIDYSDGEDGEDEGMKKLANTFLKRFKFGDVINVFGDALNKVIVEEVEDEEGDDDDLLASLGGRAKPRHAQNYTAKTYINELRIHGVDAWDKQVYKEEDFDIEDDNPLAEKEDKRSKALDEFGGKKKKSNNPFASDDIDEDDPFSDDVDIDDDNLPF